jgi:hypothetical protein
MGLRPIENGIFPTHIIRNEPFEGRHNNEDDTAASHGDSTSCEERTLVWDAEGANCFAQSF